MKTFKVGDVVRLVSGGPSMAVVGDSATKNNPIWIVCAWFDAQGHYQESPFHEGTLVSASDNPANSHP